MDGFDKPSMLTGIFKVMPLYTPTIQFSHIRSRLQFSYQINMGVQELSSYTFFFKEAVAIKVMSNGVRKLEDYFTDFSDIIEGKVWNGTSYEMFPKEETNCYLMYDGNYYKIGKSNDPEKRLKEIKTGNPGCTLICYSEFVPEKFLQFVYKHKHYSLEWFKLEHADVEFIKALMSAKSYEQAQCIMRMCSTRIDRNKPKRLEIQDKKINAVKLDFGKYKGMKISNMWSKEHKDYLQYLKDNWKGAKTTLIYKAINHACSK